MTSNFLDNTCTKVQNMAFKTSQMDQIALEYWYYGSLGRLRVDGRGFLHQTPILKNCPPERNQFAAHAQKRVTVPLSAMWYKQLLTDCEIPKTAGNFSKRVLLNRWKVLMSFVLLREVHHTPHPWLPGSLNNRWLISRSRSSVARRE